MERSSDRIWRERIKKCYVNMSDTFDRKEQKRDYNLK